MSLRQTSSKKLRKNKNKWKVDSWEEYEEREDTFLKERLQSKEPTIPGKVRITGGSAKNIMIQIPKTTRPLTDRMKVRIFDILSKDIAGKTILDLYAGTGSFALEALSRGAKHAVLVDAAKNAYHILESNVSICGFLAETEIVKSKVDEFLYKAVKSEQKFDIIFMDPPYKLLNTKRLYKMQNTINLASQLLPIKNKRFKGVVILKHPRRYPLERLKLDIIEKFESYELGLNSITIFIVKTPKKV
ncbi:RsmD family RNA methyltransferase [bacterium]|nr:RsmD family RNA methyltransferase [bacterium]